MADTKFQPTIILPGGETRTDAEENFIDETPPNIFPENSDSNWGYKRKVFSDVLQDAIDQLDTIFVERFIDTSTDFLDEWEEQMLVPTIPNASLTLRRNIVHSRMLKGAFTRPKITEIVEHFLTSGGAPTELTPDGVTLDSSGITLYGEGGPVATLYRVYESPTTYSYAVWIVNSFTPDIAGLTRELTRITPAGISFTIDNAHANILDYQRAVLSDGPTGYWPLATTSGTGNPWQSIVPGGPSLILTFTGSPTNTGTLVQNTGGVIGDNQSRDFNGTVDYLQSPNDAVFAFGQGAYSLEAWVSIDAFPAVGQRGEVLSLGGEIYAGKGRIGITNPAGTTYWAFGAGYQSDPIVQDAEMGLTSPVPVLASIYHIVGTWTGQRARFYVNGVKVFDSTYNMTNAKTFFQNGLAIGRYWHAPSQFFNGKIDEPAVYGYALSDAQVLKHYRTGMNLL